MSRNVKKTALHLIALSLLLTPPVFADDMASELPLQIVVMDPLSDQLACDCVAGYAQRKYGALQAFLQTRLKRPVELTYAESLMAQNVRARPRIHVIIGKYSVVESDAREIKQPIRSLAMLSGRDGTITQTGLFVVRSEDPAQSIEDLAGRSLLLGPADSDEKHAAALAALEAFAVPAPAQLETKSSCSGAALAVFEKDADAAVLSSYALPLLEGCGTIDAGALRIVGQTDPLPFIGLFATNHVDPALEMQLMTALTAMAVQPNLLTAMESRVGFVPLPALSRLADKDRDWPDWRGPGRDGVCPDVPSSLATSQLLWSHTMTGPGMAGLAVAEGRVIATDKSLSDEDDLFRCLDAETGRQLWKLTYPAPGEMDFTNSPRANPLVHEGLVYLLGAYGHLHCVQLDSGEVLWKTHLQSDFGAELPTWGYCSTPLIVDDKLIVNPGAEDASLVALDRRTGVQAWATPGDPPGYGSLILAELGGIRQIVGHDVASLGGWDPETGARLWKLVPEWEGDFNVATPIITDGRLLVSTENNGTRLHAFDADGKIIPEPVAGNEDLVPDTSTPVVYNGLVLGSCFSLMCLDLKDDLKTLWEYDEEPFGDYASMIAGNGRFLVTTQVGTVALVKADRSGFQSLGALSLFDDVADSDRDVWSHPALIGNRLYIRNMLGVYCFLLQ